MADRVAIAGDGEALHTLVVDDEEARMGLRCVAAVVYSDCSEPLAAISVSGMTSRVTEDRAPELGRIVRDVAAELTVALGGVMPEAKQV